MAGSKSKPKEIEIAKKMGKKRPNSALTDGEEAVNGKDAKRRKGTNFCILCMCITCLKNKVKSLVFMW